MSIGDPGSPWTIEDAQAVGRAEWVQVGGLTRGDFPADVLAALGRDRRLALDGQALVRPAVAGPLVLDSDFDPAVLRHVTALKLNEEEVAALGGEEQVDRARRPRAPAHARVDRRPADQPRRPGADPGASDRHRRSDRRRRCVPRRLRVGARGRPPSRLGRPPCRDDGRAGARADRSTGRVIALVRTIDGVFRLDVETEVVFGETTRQSTTSRSRSNCPGWWPLRPQAQRSSPSSTAVRRSSSPTTRASPGTRPAAVFRPASTSPSTPPTPTGSSSPRATDSTSPRTAAASGAHSRRSSPTWRPWPGG